MVVAIGRTNIDKREIVSIGPSKVEVFPVELELGSLRGNETLRRSVRGRSNEAGRRNDEQVKDS